MDRKSVIEMLRGTDAEDGGETILRGLCESTYALVLSSAGEREGSELEECAR